MATVSANVAGHATLGAATVDTVNLTSSGRRIQVINHTAATIIYVRTGKSAATTTDPTVGGNDCFAVAASSSTILPWPLVSDGQTVCVKLISAGTPAYSVQVLTDLVG